MNCKFRYFNSWIEAEDIDLPEGNTSMDSSSDLILNRKERKEIQIKVNIPKKRDLEESLLQLDNIGDAPPNTSESADISWCEDISREYVINLFLICHECLCHSSRFLITISSIYKAIVCMLFYLSSLIIQYCYHS